jgi:hypothetical protein
MAVDEAIRSAAQLKRPDGGWDRVPGAAKSGTPSADGTLAGATLQISDLIDTVRQLKVLGREKYLRMIERHFTVSQQLAAALCGLDSSPLMMNLPVTTDESPDYIRRHEADWRILDEAAPAELSSRVHRLWLLLLRAKLEQM